MELVCRGVSVTDIPRRHGTKQHEFLIYPELNLGSMGNSLGHREWEGWKGVLPTQELLKWTHFTD